MALPLVSLEHVDVALEGDVVLRDLTWRLERGQSWAVLGGNGAGKSTFLRLVRGELWPMPGRGRRIYALDGVSQLAAVGVSQAMPLVSPEMQMRCLQLEWTRTVQQLVESGFGGGDYAYTPLTASQRRQALRLAQRVGVADLWRRNIQQISTGELRRALIARALAGKPRVLICDELCDGLDAKARSSLLQLLQGLVRSGTPLLLTTHREEELFPSIRNRLFLEKGRLKASSPRPAFDKVVAPAKQASASPTQRADPPESAPVLIQIRGASVYLGRRRVLRDMRWELRAGQHWAVLGPNGSGKSTFLKLIAGDVHPARGATIRRFGLGAGYTLWDVRRRIGFVSPEFQAGYRENLTGADVIVSGFFSSVGLIQRPSPRQRERARTVAKQLGFGALTGRRATALSYGEFRKLLLARALVHAPRVLVLDEPFDGLDAASRNEMRAVLERVAQSGTSLVMVTHHETDLPPCITNILRLRNGRRVESRGECDG